MSISEGPEVTISGISVEKCLISPSDFTVLSVFSSFSRPKSQRNQKGAGSGNLSSQPMSDRGFHAMSTTWSGSPGCQK